MSGPQKKIQVGYPWKEMEINVYEINHIPLLVARMLFKHPVKLKIFLEDYFPEHLFHNDQKLYISPNGVSMEWLVSLEGILLYAEKQLGWSVEKIAKAKEQFEDENRIVKTSVENKRKRVNKKDTEHILSEITDTLDAVKEENRKLKVFVLDIISQTGSYQSLLDEKIKEKIDSMEPVIRKEIIANMLQNSKLKK